MGPFSSERQASQLKRREKVREIHILRSEGYKIGQIAENVGMSTKSISRMLSTDPESMCVDGLQYIGKSLEAYKEQIYELMERGFKNAQIQRKINSMFPEANIKISTLGDFCRTARAELLENTDKTNPAMTPAGNTPKLDGNSDLEIYADKINEMLSEDKETALIYAMIKADGYSGSYEVFAQYCLNMNPAALLSEKDERVCREMPGGKKDSKTVTRQSSQLKRYEKVREIHILRSEGYTSGQISQMKGISAKTVKRLLNMEPEYMCVDGTQVYEKRKLLYPYKEQIYELLERGFRSCQILQKLCAMYPGVNIKCSTLNDFCRQARAKLFDYTQNLPENPPILSDDSILAPYAEKINGMLTADKHITVIFAEIKVNGYTGSYSLLQQYCHKIKPVTYRMKKVVRLRTINRKVLSSEIWSGKTDLTEGDVDYINTNYPVFGVIKNIITEFRTAYSDKNTDAVKSWCDRYSQCKFPAICSFINGINLDNDAFYNSMKYDYNNGLLEGSVNKLKNIKRSMFGRAGYSLLRAKLLLANGN